MRTEGDRFLDAWQQLRAYEPSHLMGWREPTLWHRIKREVVAALRWPSSWVWYAASAVLVGVVAAWVA